MREIVSEPNTHEERRRFWHAHISSWMENCQHQTQAKYCAEHGLSESAFTKWKDKLYPKLRRSKHPTRRARFWEGDIKQWHKGNKSQADYCNLHALSQSAFSKWKNKLHPELRGRRDEKKQKNHYAKFAKISNEQVDTLIRGFLSDTPAKALAVKSNISIRTCYKYLCEIRRNFFIGATEYPTLFNGAGMLLFFGPPPHIHERLMETYKGKKKKIGKRKLSKIVKEAVIYHSHYDWSVADSWYFYYQGWGIFYKIIYSEIHGLDPLKWSPHHQSFMKAEYSVGQAINRLWDYYLTNNFQELFAKDIWDAFYYERIYDNSRKHERGMQHDLKWIMLNHDPLRRNTFWDIKPSELQLYAVQEKIRRYFEMR